MGAGWLVTRIDRCVNAACPNRAHEGEFVVMESEANVVGGHRPIRLLMCSPCASAFVEVSKKGGAW